MTTLIEEEPFAAVVADKFIESTCAKCFSWAASGVKENVKLNRCAACLSVFYCSKECQKADWDDHKGECKAFCTAKFVPSQNIRLLARVFHKMMLEPTFKAFNGRSFNSLADNCDHHYTDAGYIEKVDVAYNELRRFLGHDTPSFDILFVVYAKIATNSFGILDSSPECFMRGIGLYIGLSVLDHSCRPDAFVISSGPKLVLRTTKEDCVYSDKLTICYPSRYLFRNTSMRREYLSTRCGFICNCEECNDEDADKILTSGRPDCCFGGYFSLADLRCSICNEEVSLQDKNDVEASNNLLHKVAIEGEDDGPEKSKLKVPTLMSLFREFEFVLSDENAYLIGLADMIFSRALPRSPGIALQYGNFCLRYVRNRPHSLYSAILKTRIFCLSDRVQKPLKDIKEALARAIEAVEVIYGEDHELTTALKQKQAEIHLRELGIH